MSGARRERSASGSGISIDVALLTITVAVVLGDSGTVALALPEILRDFNVAVGAVAWVLIAFNLALAVVAVPVARGCARRDPAIVNAVGLVAFTIATAACGWAPSLAVLIAGRVIQAAAGAVCLVGALELLVAAEGSHRSGLRRWTAAGVTGTAFGPVAGGFLTAAFSWRAIFLAQIPVMLLALPIGFGWRGRIARAEATGEQAQRGAAAANIGLALLSAAVTAALFLLILLLVDGWSRSPLLAAVTVTTLPLAELASRPVLRSLGAGLGAQVLGGAVLIAGGLAGLALLPAAQPAWTLAPQALIGLGLGLSFPALTEAALGDGTQRMLGAARTISARHAGVVAGLAILTPIFTADLRRAQTPAKEAIARLVLDAPLPGLTKLEIAGRLGRGLAAERGRVPNLRPAFAGLKVPHRQAQSVHALERGLDDQLKRAATHAFVPSFLIAAALALLAIGPALALAVRRRP